MPGRPAGANAFRCTFAGTGLTSVPIVDDSSPILRGRVGACKFPASVGEVPGYFDDLTLSIEGGVPLRTSLRAAVKKRYR